MIKKAEEMLKEIKEQMRGGNGSVEITHIFKQDELTGKARIFAKITINPGCSIGLYLQYNDLVNGGVKVNDFRILWKNTILSRLIVVFILIIAPIYFLTINIFGWSRNVLEQQIFTAMQSQVSYYLRDLESSIERIKSLEYDLTSDEDLNQMSNAPELLNDFEKAKVFSRIQKRLTAIKNSSGFIENVRVLIPSINWAINAAGYPKGSYSEVSGEELNALINLPHDTSSQIIYWNDRIYVSAVFPDYLQSNKMPLFIIDIE
ncbi:MAG: hypothetical protein N2Z65_08000, partial [Clostridiales bacterium]|nr:hypothetical protein [Clostridiales bacterium]